MSVVVHYRFGQFVFDCAAYTLHRSEQPVALQPKVLEVLRFLIEHRDRIVTKDELLDAIWGDRMVNEAAVAWSVSHARRALGQRRTQKEPIESIHGRGYRFTAPVETETDVAAIAAPASSATGAIARPFVGRAEVLQRLRTRLDDATRGNGGLIILCGEAGIGKTRCAEELIAYARTQGVDARLGRAVEGLSAPAFWPWIQMLREAAHAQPDLRATAEALLVRTSAAAASGSEAQRAQASEPAERFALLDAASQFWFEAAQQKPLLLVLDDLQFADAASISLLRFIAPELAHARLLVVGTLRDLVSGDRAQSLGWLSASAERFELAHFTVDEVGSYIAELTGAHESLAELSRAVHHATAGNPLFVQEAVRTLLSQADSFSGSDRAADGSPVVPPPQVARDSMRSRVQQLPPSAQSLLSRASVLGETFDLSLLASVSGEDTDALLDTLELGHKHGFVAPETPSTYRWSHDLLRQLVYNDTPASERVALHRKLAELLETRAMAEPHHHEIAFHYYQSLPLGDYDRVRAAAERAASAAAAVSAYDDAAEYYAWALQAQALAPQVEPRERAELLLASAGALAHAGRDRVARATLTRVFELARQYGYLDLLLSGARLLRPTHAMSGVPDTLVREALEEVLRRAPEGGNALRIAALSRLACVPPYSRNMQQSKDLSAQARKLAQEFDQPASTLEVFQARLYALSGPDDCDALLACCREVFAHEGGSATLMTHDAHAARMNALLYRGDLAGADAALEAHGRIARARRWPEAMWYHDRVVAQRRVLSGDFAAAEAASDVLASRARRIGLSYGAEFVAVIRRRIQADRHGIATLADAMPWRSVAANAALQPWVRARALRMLAETGQTRDAASGFAALAADDFLDIPRDIAYLNTLANSARVAIAVGDRPRGERIYALLAPYATYNTPDTLSLYDGSVSGPLAQLAVFLERSEARQHFEDALTMNAALGYTAELARTSHAYALWLEGCGKRADAARVHELRQGARELAESIGMTALP